MEKGITEEKITHDQNQDFQNSLTIVTNSWRKKPIEDDHGEDDQRQHGGEREDGERRERPRQIHRKTRLVQAKPTMPTEKGLVTRKGTTFTPHKDAITHNHLQQIHIEKMQYLLAHSLSTLLSTGSSGLLHKSKTPPYPDISHLQR
jgi:hypothetical protein